MAARTSARNAAASSTAVPTSATSIVWLHSRSLVSDPIAAEVLR